MRIALISCTQVRKNNIVAKHQNFILKVPDLNLLINMQKRLVMMYIFASTSKEIYVTSRREKFRELDTRTKKTNK